MSPFATELVGYVASTLILLSVTRTSILKLRIIGLAGSTAFVVYALLIEAYPIVIVNTIIAGVHLYFLYQLQSRRREFFRLLRVDSDSKYLLDFLSFYGDEIDKFQPEFSYVPGGDEQVRTFVLRDMVPAGLFIGSIQDTRLSIDLDFVIPQYRDMRVAQFLFSASTRLTEGKRLTEAVTRSGTEVHNDYLERIGFQLRDGAYVKDLEPIAR